VLGKLGDVEERVQAAFVIALVALSLVASVWLGVILGRRIGSAFWLRVTAAAILGGALLLVWFALSAYAGNCAGREYGVEDYYPDWQITRVLYIVAWPSACLVALCIGCFAQLSVTRVWIATAIGLIVALVLFFVLYILLQPPLFEPCIPTPLT